MAAISRLLQAIGWVWVIAGFLLPAFGLARPNIFPGFILIFVARALRTQAARRAPREEEVEGTPQPEPVVLTEPELSAPPPVTTSRAPTPSPRPRPERPEPPVEPTVASDVERDDIIERIALAGRIAGGEPTERQKPPVTAPAEREERKTPMTSAEMIAQAKKRWDTKS